MAITPSLNSVTLKIDRARTHMDSIAKFAQSYRAGKHRIVREPYNDATQFVFRLKMVPVDPAVSPIIGDFVHNVRSALDHLVYQLVLANDAVPCKNNQFPICNTPAGFHNQLKRDRLCGVSTKATNLIERLQPYPGSPNQALWDLSDFDNIDKHRTLIVTSGLVLNAQITMTHEATQARIGAGSFMNMFHRDGEIMYGPIDIGAGSPFEHVNMEPDGTSYIAFNEGVYERELMGHLSEIIDFVEKTVIPRFKPFL